MIFKNPKYFFKNENNVEYIPTNKYRNQNKIDIDTFLEDYVKRKYRKSLKRNFQNGDIVELQTDYSGQGGALVYSDGYLYLSYGRNRNFLHYFWVENMLENERRFDIQEVNVEGFTLNKNVEFESYLRNGAIIRVKSNMYTFFYTNSYA